LQRDDDFDKFHLLLSLASFSDISI